MFACRGGASMVRIRTASSEKGRWAAAGLLGLAVLAGLLLWQFSGGVRGAGPAAVSSLSQVRLGLCPCPMSLHPP